MADEVRSLALRAADAAKSTAELVEGTVKKVRDGSDLVSTTNEAFGEVATSASKVGELLAEIAAASKEQAQGIEQVNVSVGQMDAVTQQTAANAEESASASEELNAQAEQLRRMVLDLRVMVEGANGEGDRLEERDRFGNEGGNGHQPTHRLLPGPRAREKSEFVLHAGGHGALASGQAARDKPTNGKSRPADVIPFDDDEAVESVDLSTF